MQIKKIKYVLSLLFVSISVVVIPQIANASYSPSVGSMELINTSCPAGPGQYQELVQLKKEIASSGTIGQARKMALGPTDDAINALKNARVMMPFSDDLRKAETRLSDARSRILVASNQEQVADAFDVMMLAGLDNDSAAKVSAGGSSCNYSTGEIIAIVVGLILGIIPGLILLVVLC